MADTDPHMKSFSVLCRIVLSAIQTDLRLMQLHHSNRYQMSSISIYNRLAFVNNFHAVPISYLWKIFISNYEDHKLLSATSLMIRRFINLTRVFFFILRSFACHSSSTTTYSIIGPKAACNSV